MNSAISAIILAAGTSSRMGKMKQILALGDQTILEHVIHRTLVEDFSEVIVVVGHEAKAIRNAISIDNQRFRWVENEAYLSGQSTSLKLGIESLQEQQSNIMVFLGDLPFISAETIRLIYKTGMDKMKETDEAYTIRPTYKGISGHPVFFGNRNRDLFTQLHGDKGAKLIMDKIPNHIRLEVEDRGVLFDVDTPEDYAEAKRIFSI
jgi:molybdenum cofactor cytidylyltransferase